MATTSIFETKCGRRIFLIDKKQRRRNEALVIRQRKGRFTVFQCRKHPSMDWRNEESDQSSVENLKWDENDDPVIRTRDVAIDLDRNVCSQGIQVGTDFCKDVKSFTSVLEQLELETNDHPELRTSDAQTDYFNDSSEQEDAVPVFKTREISTFQLVIQGPEILNFQGTRHSPADIAPYWKKDSRMWLWKSVRLARRICRSKAKIHADALSRKELS